MKLMTCVAIAALFAMPAVAQTSEPITVVARPAISGQSAVLPANTDVSVTLNSELSSKKVKEGHKFDLSVSRDVMLGDYIVIPRGTLARGAVTYRTGKGSFGKSAKMEIDITSLELNGRSISAAGHFRQEGQGNTGATVGAVVAVGVFSAFVTGRSAIFEQGREFHIFTREPIPVTLVTSEPAAPVAAAIPVATAAPTASAAPVPASTN